MMARILSMFVAQIIGLLIYRKYQPDASAALSDVAVSLSSAVRAGGMAGRVRDSGAATGRLDIPGSMPLERSGSGLQRIFVLAWKKQNGHSGRSLMLI